MTAVDWKEAVYILEDFVVKGAPYTGKKKPSLRVHRRQQRWMIAESFQLPGETS